MGLKLYLIAAACENMGIGYKNELPWALKKEMAYFNRLTTNTTDPNSGKTNVVVMGRNTWESIPEKYRPLRNRLNIVLTRSDMMSEVLTYPKWDDVINDLSIPEKLANIDKVWVIGGNAIYKSAIESPNCHRIYLTRILKKYECDVFFPEFDPTQFALVKDADVPDGDQEEDGIKYRFEVYERKN